MKRTLLSFAAIVAAGLLVHWTAAQLLAGPPAEQQAKPPVKLTVVGTIDSVNAKQRMLCVKPAAASQQIQVQSGQAPAKDKPREGVLVFVDAKTQISVASAAQRDVPLLQELFPMLAAGQVVRVVYEPAAATVQAQGAQAQAVPVKGDAPAEGPVAKGGAAQQSSPAAQKVPAKQSLPRHALAIEILAGAQAQKK